MSIVLGIDAGGTYTDAALYDLGTDTLLASAKAPTTPPQYVGGVKEAVDRLPHDTLKRVSHVALSTTLATNAIVEGRHAPAGLILIGYDDYESASVGWTPCKTVTGRHTIRGAETVPFAEDEFRQAVTELLAEGVAGIAVSSIMSTRNPDHEIRATAIARDMTGIPIVAGHNVAGVLNAVVRASTAALNAGLIPIVHRFIAAVENVLENAGIGSVPVFMVTGDGSLLSTSAAMQRPVKTILSGPACSALGAAKLAKASRALVVDIGGTTTDIAVLIDGLPRMAEKGVSVGKWHAGVRSAQVVTRGLGGDSQIGTNRRVQVGPRRVIPVSVAAALSPDLLDEYREMVRECRTGTEPGGDWKLTEPTDAFVRIEGEPPAALTNQERAILDALAHQPLTRRSLAASIEYPYLTLLQTNRLESWNLIQRVGLTPTDLWHVTGEDARWDPEAAQAAADLAAFRLGTSVEQLIEEVRETVTRFIVRQALQAHFGVDGEIDSCHRESVAAILTRVALGEVSPDGVVAGVRLKPPIIGVGAPASIFMQRVAERIDASLVIPEGADVANAVGAAVGTVTATKEALIRPQEDESILCYAPEERRLFANREDAVAWAADQLLPAVDAELIERGAAAASIRVTVSHRGAEVINTTDPIWWETVVTAHGIGQPGSKHVSKSGSEVQKVEEWSPGLKDAEARRGMEIADGAV